MGLRVCCNFTAAVISQQRASTHHKHVRVAALRFVSWVALKKIEKDTTAADSGALGLLGHRLEILTTNTTERDAHFFLVPPSSYLWSALCGNFVLGK
jgi:hypothetical protein